MTDNQYKSKSDKALSIKKNDTTIHYAVIKSMMSIPEATESGEW